MASGFGGFGPSSRRPGGGMFGFKNGFSTFSRPSTPASAASGNAGTLGRTSGPAAGSAQTTGGGTASRLIGGVTFGSKPVYTGGPGFFELTLGIAPGRGAAVMRAKDVADLRAKNTPFTLEIRDGRASVKIERVYVEEVEHLAPAQDGEAMVIVRFADRRSLWQYGPPSFSDFLNIRRESGKTYVGPSVSGGTAYTFDQVLQRVADKLELGIKVATGIGWVPSIEAMLAPAHTVLERLLEHFAHDLAVKVDGTYHLVPLTVQAFQPPQGVTISEYASEEGDSAHRTPKTLRVGVLRFREKAFTTWEPVMQFTGDESGGYDQAGAALAAPAEKAGEWGPVDDVLKYWGVSRGFVAKAYYTDHGDQFDRVVIPKLGGGDLGRMRFRILKAQLYRYWRLSDTDREKILPFAPLRSTTAGATGRGSALEAVCTRMDGHHPRRDGMAGGKPGPYFADHSGSGLHQAVRIVDAREGIVEISGETPACKVEIARNSGKSPQDYALAVPTAPTITVGFYHKFASPTEAMFHIRTREVEPVAGGTNGQTWTRRAERLVLRETFDPSAGDFTASNIDEVNTLLDEYLERWAEEFKIPAPERYEIAGVGPLRELTPAVRAIQWSWEEGRISVRYRVNSDRSPDRYGLGTRGRLRSHEIAERAEAAAVTMPDDPRHGGGDGAVGLFGATPPPLRDFQVSRHRHGALVDPPLVWVNPDAGAILVAEDWRNGPTDDKCCEPPPASTEIKKKASTTGVTGTGAVTGVTTGGIARGML